MNTKNKLDKALKEAIRSVDEQRKRTLRMALSAIRFAEVEKREELDETGVMAILRKEIKGYQESLAEAEKAGRQDLVDDSRAQIAILEEFLPQPLTVEELETLARQAVLETGAVSIKEMGRVMQLLMPRLQGRAAGDQVSQIVRKLLQ